MPVHFENISKNSMCVKKNGTRKKKELAMRLGKEGGSMAALLRNKLAFRSSYPARGQY
jgi:hypothetical protein